MADIYINNGDDLFAMTRELLDASGAARLFAAGQRVLVKPNLVVEKPPSEGATTHPEIVEAIIVFLRELGVTDIVIAEGSGVGNDTTRAFSVCGYDRLASGYGVRLLNTQKDEVRTVEVAGHALGICAAALDADVIVNVPVLKGHCQTWLTCCLKNLKGLIPDREKRRYHTLGIHDPVAALNMAVRPQLHVVDAVCGDRTYEEGGTPVQTDQILLGFDAALIDSYAATLLGYAPEEIGYLKRVCELGYGQYADDSTEIVEFHREKRRTAELPNRDRVRQLARHVDADEACSICYALLISSLNRAGTPKHGEIIHIGQGFRGKKPGRYGSGDCCRGCDTYAPGCPPKSKDIIAMLRGME